MTRNEAWQLLGRLEGAHGFWTFLLAGASGTPDKGAWLPVLHGQKFIDSEAAELFGATEEQVQTWRARLVEHGLLRAESAPGGARHWVRSEDLGLVNRLSSVMLQ
jgi:hypothetical protein